VFKAQINMYPIMLKNKPNWGIYFCLIPIKY